MLFQGLTTMMTKNVSVVSAASFIRHHHRHISVSARLWDNTSSNTHSFDSSKSKIVHFIRHGEGYHNFMDSVAKEAGAIISDIDDYDIAVKENRFYIKSALEDPPLTAEGYADAKKLQEIVLNMNMKGKMFKPKLFIVSPLRRATQTVMLGFHHYLKQEEDANIPIIALECCREQYGIYYSDKRSDISQYAIEFPQVNYELIQSNEDILWNKYSRESKTHMLSRQEEFLSFIRNQTEVKEVVVGTHSGWLKVLTKSMLNIEIPEQRESIQSMFATGEMRSLLLTWEDEKEDSPS